MRLLGCSALWALAACGDKPTEVELRLYPCDLTSGLPTSVALTIQSSGADGKIGEPLAKTFPIADQAVFDDGFATVGFTPPAGTLSADITVVWTADSEVVQARYNLNVPALGEVMPLGKEECEPPTGTTSTPTTTDDPTTMGPGTTETGPSTETGTTTDTGTMTTDPTETTSTSSTSTSTGDSETTTETTTSTTETTSTTDTTMGTSGGPMEGGNCNNPGSLACDAGPGALGNLLQCQIDTWVLKNDFCQESTCENLGFDNPQPVGCFGDEQSWACACAETPQGECDMGMQSQCGAAIGMDVLVELCVEDGPNTYYYAAQCGGCVLDGGKPLCTLD